MRIDKNMNILNRVMLEKQLEDDKRLIRKEFLKVALWIFFGCLGGLFLLLILAGIFTIIIKLIENPLSLALICFTIFFIICFFIGIFMGLRRKI